MAATTFDATSSIIYWSGNTITQARLDAEETGFKGADDATYYLSADNGNNYEEVTPGQKHVFTQTGEKLRWKITLTRETDSNDPRITGVDVEVMEET